MDEVLLLVSAVKDRHDREWEQDNTGNVDSVGNCCPIATLRDCCCAGVRLIIQINGQGEFSFWLFSVLLIFFDFFFAVAPSKCGFTKPGGSDVEEYVLMWSRWCRAGLAPISAWQYFHFILSKHVQCHIWSNSDCINSLNCCFLSVHISQWGAAMCREM